MKVTYAWGKHPTFKRYSGKHHYKGSLHRHVIIEDLFNWLSKPTSVMYNVTHSIRLYRFVRVPFVIVWGLNCGFPLRDVMKYLAFWVRHATI